MEEDRITPQQRESLCRQLPEPKDYYVGRCPPEKNKVENLLLFTRTTTPFQNRKTSHYRFVMVRPLEKSGTLLLDNLTFKLNPGQILLIQPQQFHHFTDFADAQILWLLMTFEVSSPERYGPLKNSLWEPNAFQMDCLDRILTAYVDHKPEIPELLMQTLLEEWLSMKTLNKRGAAETDRVQKIISLIFHHLDKKFTLTSLAEAAGFSESHLRTLFREKTGMSLGNYIKQIRIHRASLLLVKTANPVGEIGKSCGFESPYTFSRAFKNETGLSPREYRQFHHAGFNTQ